MIRNPLTLSPNLVKKQLAIPVIIAIKWDFVLAGWNSGDG
jgi:hypothetical protein